MADKDVARSIRANVKTNIHAEIEEINLVQINTNSLSETKSRGIKEMNPHKQRNRHK